MKNCSYCGRENEDPAPVCSECQMEFPAPAPEDEARLRDPAYRLVVLATFSTVVEADMVKARLEAAGIEACIPEELNPQIFWNFIPSVLEAVTVRVTARDYDAAKELLGQINSEEQPDEQRVQAAAAPRSPGQPPPLPQP